MFALRLGQIQQLSYIKTVLVSLVDFKVNDSHRFVADHNQIGPEASMTYNFKEGDLTHFNRKGAEASAGLILEELKTVLPDVASYVKVAGPAEQRAAGLPVTQPRLKGEREAQAVML